MNNVVLDKVTFTTVEDTWAMVWRGENHARGNRLCIIYNVMAG